MNKKEKHRGERKDDMQRELQVGSLDESEKKKKQRQKARERETRQMQI